MKHDLASARRPVKGGWIADVTLNELYLPEEGRQTLAEPRLEVVNDGHIVASVKQRADEVVTDESGTARHQDSHGPSFVVATTTATLQRVPHP